MNYDPALTEVKGWLERPDREYITPPIAEIELLVQATETYNILEDVIAELDPDGEILGNDISDEYRVRRGEVKRCTICNQLVEDTDAATDTLHESCRIL